MLLRMGDFFSTILSLFLKNLVALQWFFWIIPLGFVCILCSNQKVKQEVDKLEQGTARKILTLIWVVLGGLSGMIHSPIR